MKLKKGNKIPDFSYNTAFKRNKCFYEEIEGKKTVLYFLRYYGCTVCQLDLMEIKNSYQDFEEKNISVKVVLQSDPELLKEELEKNPLPYEVISDPEMNLYEKFEIEPAKSMIELAGGKTMVKIMKAKKEKLKHGKYEGEERQLPAVFVINEDKEIILSQYTKNLGELKSPIEILKNII
jgi:peroxiredoxin